MLKFEFKVFKELYEKMKEGNQNQINLIMQEIKRLQSEINRRNERDLIKEIYEQYKIWDKGITLQEFRHGILEGEEREIDIDAIIRKALAENFTTVYPIESFTIEQLKEIADKAKENKIGLRIRKETSNFYQGTLLEVQRLDNTVEKHLDEKLIKENKELQIQNRELTDALQELVNIIKDSLEGKYKIDSFTTQYARKILEKAKRLNNEVENSKKLHL